MQTETPVAGFKFQRPAFLKFKHPALRETFDVIDSLTFQCGDNGRVLPPPEMRKLYVNIGQSTYRLGIGGLHSNEQCKSHYSTDDHQLFDVDVTSEYPMIILNQGLYPPEVGPQFVDIFRQYVERRIEAKRNGDDVTAASLKIAINGIFGKFGSKYSFLYSPQNIVQVTLSGQGCLLMLIEDLEEEGIPVVSANTDGVVIKCPTDKVDMMRFIVNEWETKTGFETEENAYRSLHSRDVNNYIAIKSDSYKCKGEYSPPSLMKNPDSQICNEAVVRYLIDGTPLEDTIRNSKDITDFVTVRTVRDGAVDQNDKYLGKVIRWYYAKGIDGSLTYKVNGYRVPKSDGAKALMDLPSNFPTDVDYEWYFGEAKSRLIDLGVPIENTDREGHRETLN